MSPTHNGTNADGELHPFERNRYFHGKLLTARDLLAEQEYHAGRLEATSRYVEGAGIVCGLDVMETEDDGTDDGGQRGLVRRGDELTVTLRPGFALNGNGNPVVVHGSGPVVVKNTEDEPDVPGENTIHLYLRYDECSIETVPKPGSENACDGECTYNRILEGFDVVFEEVPADTEVAPRGYKTVPEIAFPEPGDVTGEGDIASDDPVLVSIARGYYDENLRECRTDSDSWIFLGTFTGPDGDGPWERVETGLTHGSLVYTNDMLYAAIARHTVDFHNPHQTTLAADPVEGDDTGAVRARIRIRDDDTPSGGVDLGSSDSTISIDATSRDGETSSGLDLTVDSTGLDMLRSIDGVGGDPDGNVDLTPSGSIDITQGPGDNELTFTVPDIPDISEIPEFEGIENLENVGPDPDGNVNLTPSGSIDITQGPGDNEITFTVPEIPDVPDVNAILTLRNVEPDQAGNVELVGSRGIDISTGGNRITIRGPAVPDLDQFVSATVRRSATCKFISYSAAQEQFSRFDGQTGELMGSIARASRQFVEAGDFSAENYLRFMLQGFENFAPIILTEGDLNQRLSELSGEVFTVQSVGRYNLAFDQLDRLSNEVDETRVSELAAAQDCLARAAELLRPVEDQ